MSEPLKVSDGSQKWKIGLYLAGLALAVYFGFRVLALLGDKPLGIAITQPGFTTATNAQIACNTTTTLVVASSTDYSSFIAQNIGATQIFLCRAEALCSSTSTAIVLQSSSTADSRFVQEDQYHGTYRCAGVAAGTLNVTYSH